MPTNDKKFKGRKVTKFLLDDVDDNMVSLLLDVSRSEGRVYLTCVMKRTIFCNWENKGADQLCGNCVDDQRLCFRYTDCNPSTS